LTGIPTGRLAAVTRAIAFLTAATLAMAGCSAGTKRESLSPQTLQPSQMVAVEGPAPVGRFYVKAGADDLAADLYELTFSPPRFQRLTTGARVTTVGGCATRIVVAAAQREVGYLDTLQEFRDGKLVPVDKLGPEHASDPDLSPECRMLFQETKGTAPNTVGQIKRYDPVTGTVTDIASGPSVVGASWGPSGQILVLRREPTGPKLDIIRADGTKQEIDPKVPDIGNTPWGKTGWIAMAVFTTKDHPPTSTLFMKPTTGQRSTLDGWLPLSWSPTGEQLLVRDATRGTTLAVVDASDLTKTRNIAVSVVGTVWDAVWLPA
jgi:hypothetical protein